MSVLTLEAKLERIDPNTPWGFRMQGGKDFNCPLSIQRVNPGSLAAKCGLHVGDVILKIGNADTSFLRHKEAQNSIISAGNRLDLLLQRGGAPMRPGGYDSFPAPSFNAGGYGAPQSFGVQQPSPAPFKPSYDAGLAQRTQNLSLSPGSGAPPPPAPMFAPKPAPTATSSVTFQPKPAGPPAPPPPPPPPPPPAPAVKPWSPPAPAPRPPPPAPAPRPMGGGGGFPPLKPTGGKARRGRVGEAVTKPPSTDRIPVCASCKIAIRGPFVTALGSCWCPDHFICANPQCGVKLIDIGFVEEGGYLYCERDYEKYMAPHCNKCNGAIIGECVNALQTTWHPTCFLCTQCKQPIGGNQFHIEEGKPYCEKDWAAMFQTMCAGCDFPIEPGDRWVEAMSKNFHAECFNCSTCQVSLEGVPFIAKGGKAFCKKHAR
ncbi:PDZ and LIM domain protein 7-like isoform X2 [Babylonia areolata]|uniref:PDZ and LIM domain protein 7-like isoform X2 n=1 Tax=Babylonia areolata TaxID=304850 RepID=UPI003FD145B7